MLLEKSKIIFTSLYCAFVSLVIRKLFCPTMMSTINCRSFSKNGSTTVISTPNVTSCSISKMHSVVVSCDEISSISVRMGSTRKRFKTNCLFGIAAMVLFSVSTQPQITAGNQMETVCRCRFTNSQTLLFT